MRRIGLALVLLVLGAAAVLALAGRAALSAADELQLAQRELSGVRTSNTTGEQALTALRTASDHVDAASGTLDAWSVDVVAAVPVLGRSWVAERAVAQAAQEVVAGAMVLADGLPALRASAGGVDVQALVAVREELHGPAQRSASSLETLEDLPTGLTPPQVGAGVQDAVTALRPAVEAFSTADTGLGLAAGLLGADGPRSLLVMLQNNAELRGAGGYAATFATGDATAGRLTLGPLRDVYEVADPPERARRVPAPEEYVEDFGPLSGDTTIWRSWNMSPDIPDSALVGATVAGELLPARPDVVLLLDVPAMGALARLAGGDVVLPDGSAVGPEELTQALLVDAYAEAGNDAGVQAERRAALRAAASGLVGRLLTGGVSAVDAVRTLSDLAAGRHVAVWSARAPEQAALVDLGWAGDVQPNPGGDLFHVSVNNVGANKLDYYVERKLELDVEVGARTATVVQRARFTNRAPEGLVPYVEGYERPGVVTSRVELSVPAAAADITAEQDGARWGGTLHTGGDRQRLSTIVTLARGASAELEVRYELPIVDGGYDVRVIPQALVNDAPLRLSVRGADGTRLEGVDGATVTDDGTVEETQPLARVRTVRVTASSARTSGASAPQ